MFQRESDIAGSLLTWSATVGSITYESMDFRQLDPLIEWMDGHVGLLSDVPLDIEAAVATGMMIGILVRQPFRQDLAGWIERSLSLSRTASSAYSRLYAYIWIVTAYWWFGDYARAEMVVGDVENAVKTGEPLLAVTWHFLAAAVRNQARPAEDTPLSIVDEGLQIAVRSGLNQWVPLLMAEGFLAAINKGDMKAASRFIAKMDAIRDEVPNVMRCRCYHSSALYRLMVNDLPGAVRYAEETLKTSIEGGWSILEGYSHLVLSLVLLEAGQVEKAAAHLQEYRARPEISSPLFRYTRLVVEAALALEAGNDSDDILRETFSLARREGFVNLFTWWQPSLMLRLCEAALERGIEVEYVHHIIRVRNLVPEQPPLHLENWPWPVRIYTLGTFRILRENLPVPFSRKAQKKPLQMLKAMIAAGGVDVSESRLIEMLWPDSAGDAAYSAFTTTLSRLRHLLRQEEAIVVHDGRVSLDRRHVWVDAWSFDRLTGQAMESEGPSKRRSGLAGRAIGLYGGHFLASEDEYWVLSPRESFRNKFLRLILKIADQEDEAGNCEEAVSFYQKGLEVDDMDEELYQRLIICYKKAGRIPEALNVYKRCKAILQARLGIAPSLKTQALYEKLT